MWYALQDPATNIRYVAMNIKSILINNDIKGDKEALTATALAFARYNGKTLNDNTKTYAAFVEKYYYAFKSIGG